MLLGKLPKTTEDVYKRQGQGDRHLEILAALFRKIMHDDFREQLAGAGTADEVIELIGIV